MQNNIALIDRILEKLSQQVDSSGLLKASLTIEMAQMLYALQENLKKSQEENQNGSKQDS